MTLPHVVSTLVMGLLIAGLCWRRHRRVHVPLMVAAALADAGLVAYIEGTRHVVHAVLSHPRPLVVFHAGVSVAVLCGYVVVGGLGRALWNGREAVRGAHRRIGMTLILLRTVNYITSFLITS